MSTAQPDLRCLDLPDLEADHRLRAVLEAALVEAGARTCASDTTRPHWGASFFGLDRSPMFLDCGPEVRERIVGIAGQGLLDEAWYIEKSGLTYAARMVLLSPTTQERMLYSLFAADEATHFHGISQWMPPGRTPPTSPFHHLLARVIETGRREVLVFVIQVVLEGWGLRHYRAMAEACLTPGLRALFQDILNDETRHHGSGAILCATRPLSVADQDALIEILEPFLAMVRVGPVGLIEAFEGATGPLSAAHRQQLLRELGGPEHARSRLDLLRELMSRTSSAGPVVAALVARGCFTPSPIEACA
jgi:hypothetical protein